MIQRTCADWFVADIATNSCKSLIQVLGTPCIPFCMGVSPSVNALTWKINGCAIAVHKALGPGLLESAYLACLIVELRQANLRVDIDVPVPVVYRGLKLNCGYRLDLLVEDTVILELKTVAAVLPIHEAQLLTYLKLTGKPIGLLLNFNVTVMKDGITRKINA